MRWAKTMRAAGMGAGLGALSAVGCQADSASRLEGHWKGTSVEGVAPESMNTAVAFAGEMEIDVKGDILTVTTPQGKQAGRFTIEREDKTSVTLTTDKDDKADHQTFVFVNPKTMKWAVDEKTGTLITFAKQ